MDRLRSDPPAKNPGTGAGTGTGTGSEPSPGDDEKKPAAGAEAKPAKPPISNLDRYVDQRLPGWVLSRPVDAKAREGWTAREYTLKQTKPTGPAKLGGWAFAYSKPERTIVFLGFAAEDDLEKQTKIWRASAEKVDFEEPEELSTAKLEQHYARSKLIDTAFRINVRKKLVRGWKAEDTDNFIVIYDTPDQPLMRKVLRDLELIRKEYEKLFVPDKPVSAVSTVRICKSRDEYMQYGGMAGSAGFWNSESQELVLYDAEKVGRDNQKSDADTFIVLYHEAFHQFIYYSAGELPPHSWFNEGHGDFFSGATVKDGKMRSIGVNPWRIHTIQAAITDSKSVPWRDIVHFEQPQYYAKETVHVCYAQGWSMIYFLRMCKEVAAKPEWARILPTYFAVLKQAWSEEVVKLEAAGKKEDKAARWQAGLASRNKAVAAAFEGVDMDEIESSWKIFTLGLTPPDKK